MASAEKASPKIHARKPAVTVPDPPTPSPEEIQLQESKRIGDSLVPLGLFMAATTVGLIINIPASSGRKSIPLLAPFTASVCVTFFLGLGLALHSIFTPTTPGIIAWARKWLMCVSMGSLVVSVLLRLCMALPIYLFAFVSLLCVFVFLLIFFVLLLAWERKNYKKNRSLDLPV